MYLFDTDHLSILERGGTKAQRLLTRLSSIAPDDVAATIVSYEEQLRGWLDYIRKAKSIDDQVKAYKQLKKQLNNYCNIPIIEFNEQAAQEFKRLKNDYPRLGTMDLKIAAITLANKAILLTRNQKDFGKIAGLNTEDWT